MDEGILEAEGPVRRRLLYPIPPLPGAEAEQWLRAPGDREEEVGLTGVPGAGMHTLGTCLGAGVLAAEPGSGGQASLGRR